MEFHRLRPPGYAPTPLVDLPAYRRALVFASSKRRSRPTGSGFLPFKALGASHAAYRALHRSARHRARLVDARPSSRQGARTSPPADLEDGHRLGTDGPAVAWFARQVGLRATRVRSGRHGERAIDAIEGEGADPSRLSTAPIDLAVARRRSTAIDRSAAVLVLTHRGRVQRGHSPLHYRGLSHRSSTSLDEQLDQVPSLLAVQLGVGALGAAAAMWSDRSAAVHRRGRARHADRVRVSVLARPGHGGSRPSSVHHGLPRPAGCRSSIGAAVRSSIDSTASSSISDTAGVRRDARPRG